MTKLYIYPYASASESAKLLAERLGAKRIRLTNSTYVYDPSHIIINWGNTCCPYPSLNPADLLSQTVDKLRLFRLCNRVSAADMLPRYWTHADDIPSSVFPVVCRTTTKGCDGEGIVIANNRSELVDAPLYTQLIADGQEYRVTVFKDYGITDIQTKKKRIDTPCLSEVVKTYANGWGFQRLAISPDVDSLLEKLAERVLLVTGLDFCGIDVIVKNGKAYLLEVNSAMGLEGGALDRFATAVEAHVAKVEAARTPSTPEPAVEAVAPVSGASAIAEYRKSAANAVQEGRYLDALYYLSFLMRAEV